MSGREVKPEPRKESRYWVIFSAASQSSTELTLLRSGAPRSNKGWWEGLQAVDTIGEKKEVSLIQRLETDRESVFVYVNEFVSLLTQGRCCWCRLSEMQGCVSFCPTCWQYRGTLAVRSCLFASSPASAGAARLDSPWEPAAWSPARWRLSPGRWERGSGRQMDTIFFLWIVENHLSFLQLVIESMRAAQINQFIK